MTSSLANLPEEEVVASLRLAPHPEGGFYRETFRAPSETGGGRGAVTAIYFLLPRGVVSHWHKVDAVEIWLWHAGAPLMLEAGDIGGPVSAARLGPGLGAGEVLQHSIPAHGWQRAWSVGDWTLVSCIVAPAFEFVGFEMAPPGWHPENA